MDSQPMDMMSIDGFGNGGDEFWRRELFDVLVCRVFEEVQSTVERRRNHVGHCCHG